MKRILVSLSIIGIVAAIVIGATVAYLFDAETSIGNTLSADDGPNLIIRDQDEDWKDNDVAATWAASDVKPGNTYIFEKPFVGLRSSDTADHLEITCDYQVIEEDPCVESDTDCQTNLTPDEMAKEMLITNCVYWDGGLWWPINCLNDANPDYRIDDKDGDGKITFYDLKNDELDNLPPPIPGSDTWFKMSVKFAETAGNDFQGDTFDLTMAFTLNQDASQ